MNGDDRDGQPWNRWSLGLFLTIAVLWLAWLCCGMPAMSP